mmetsp:Transcript_5392/g.14826  ORF Transcript_5392/g.14826 Transcript_5392/m.14826 type:complete len:404 (+) Transcript_5392:537-1748(+)
MTREGVEKIKSVVCCGLVEGTGTTPQHSSRDARARIEAPAANQRQSTRCLAGHGLGTGHDLEELLGHRSLARAVHLRREPLAKVLGVVSRRLHGAHAGRKLGGDGLLHGAEDLAVDVEGEDGVEELGGLLLEDHVRLELLGLRTGHGLALDAKLAVLGGELEDLITRGLETLGREGHEGAHGGHGGDHGDEGGVEELHAVHLLGEEVVEDLVRELRRKLRGGRLGAGLELHDVQAAAGEPHVGLAANAEELHGDALLLELVETRLRLLDHLGVVAAAEAALARHHDEQHAVGLALLEEREVERLVLEALNEAAENLLKVLGEGAAADHGVLGAAHLGRGHKLHRRRDLLRVLDGRNARAKLADVVTHHHRVALRHGAGRHGHVAHARGHVEGRGRRNEERERE